MKFRSTSAQLFRTAMNRGASTGPLTYSFARFLAPLTHSFALLCSLRSCAPLRTFVRPKRMGTWMIRYLSIGLFWTIVPWIKNRLPDLTCRIGNLISLSFCEQTYFPIVTEKIERHFVKDVDKAQIDEIWLEHEGQPLKWHYPVGLLYDLYAQDSQLPWNVTVHFQVGGKFFSSWGSGDFDMLLVSLSPSLISLIVTFDLFFLTAISGGWIDALSVPWRGGGPLHVHCQGSRCFETKVASHQRHAEKGSQAALAG